MPAILDPMNHHFLNSNCTLHGFIHQFKGASLQKNLSFPLDFEGREAGLEFEKNTWRCLPTLRAVEGRPEALDLTLRFSLEDGKASETGVGLELVFQNWSPNHYVLMPAAVYNGNRFESRHMKYPPILKDPADIGTEVPTIISDVPRLNLHAGRSRIQQMTRDLATPAIGFQAPVTGQGFWLLTDQATRLGDSGIHIEESDDRRQATIRVSAPGVRIDESYTIGDTQIPSSDRGADINPGEGVEIRLRLYFFDCPRIQDLFDRFVEIRKDLAGPIRWQHQIPFFSAWKIQEDKYNLSNWDEANGYYSVGLRDDFLYSHWQIGWVGGLMSTYPLLAEGSPLSHQRALRTFDYVIPAGQDTSGFFYGCGKDGEWFGDNFGDIHKKWLLIRKNSDALYFLIKQFMLLHKQDANWKLPERWASSTRRCADAFVRLWDRYGQFGQFVDTQSGEIIVGGSTSAGSAPAGLALAWQYFGVADYLRVAKASAQYFYEQFVQKGYTSGGPGEILQGPDSESALGLLESFVVLFEVTAEKEWLEKARDQANQCFTWCVSYDFRFPPASTFGKLDMQTTGSVYANVQNKHSAPGICTLSGDSLFKLFRASGDRQYLDFIREIAHNLPQYLSRDDRPIGKMPAGWMNERVEMSDWLEPIGEIFDGSCWCEVSNMLTYVEIPGLYIQTDTGLVCAIDHIDVEMLEDSPDRLRIRVTNPTDFPARVKVLVETSAEAAVPLGQNGLWGCRRVAVEAGQAVVLDMPKQEG